MFDSSCQHQAVEAFAVMHAPCKRANEVQILATAPIICSLSSFGRAPPWYGGGGWIETISEHHEPVVQPAETTASEAVRWEFESPRAYQFARVVQRQRQRFQKSYRWMFESSREHHAVVAQSAEANGLNPFQCRIVACLRHHGRLAQRKSVGPTNRRARFRNSQRLPSTRVFSSAVERLLDTQEVRCSIH